MIPRLTFVLAVGFCLWLAFALRLEAHDWFPRDCCSGHDCRVIDPGDVKLTPGGFALPGNPHVIPYASPKIRRTPPEGNGAFAACTEGGKADGEPICLYIPDWGS